MSSVETSHPILPYLTRVSKLVSQCKNSGFDTSSTLNKGDLPTPSHLADLARMLKNCDSMLDMARSRQVQVRPHIKTHKTIEGALLQLFGSSIVTTTLEQFKASSRIVVSTLGEAQFFAQHGFTDILYASPIVPSKLQRIQKILNGEFAGVNVSVGSASISSTHSPSPKSLGVQIAVLIDSKFGLDTIHQKVKEMKENRDGQATQAPIKLWLDVDGGYHRTGFNYEVDSEVGTLLSEITEAMKESGAWWRGESATHAGNHFVSLQGIYYHGGNSYGAKTIAEIEKYAEVEREAVKGFDELCKKKGLNIPTLAVGSTPTCSRPPPSLTPINEIHPGNYIFYDSWQALIGSCDWSSNASFVLAQVVSVYRSPDRAAFDAGALGLSKDLGPSHIRDHLFLKQSGSSQQETPSPSTASPSNNAPAEFGLIESLESSLYISRITQEMGIIEVRKHLVSDAPDAPKAHLLLKPSQRIRIIPNHSCLSAACYPSLYIVHGDLVIDEWVTAPRFW